jgi:hypothetical protein
LKNGRLETVERSEQGRPGYHDLFPFLLSPLLSLFLVMVFVCLCGNVIVKLSLAICGKKSIVILVKRHGKEQHT